MKPAGCSMSLQEFNAWPSCNSTTKAQIVQPHCIVVPLQAPRSLRCPCRLPWTAPWRPTFRTTPHPRIWPANPWALPAWITMDLWSVFFLAQNEPNSCVFWVRQCIQCDCSPMCGIPGLGMTFARRSLCLEALVHDWSNATFVTFVNWQAINDHRKKLLHFEWSPPWHHIETYVSQILTLFVLKSGEDEKERIILMKSRALRSLDFIRIIYPLLLVPSLGSGSSSGHCDLSSQTDWNWFSLCLIQNNFRRLGVSRRPGVCRRLGVSTRLGAWKLRFERYKTIWLS